MTFDLAVCLHFAGCAIIRVWVFARTVIGTPWARLLPESFIIGTLSPDPFLRLPNSTFFWCTGKLKKLRKLNLFTFSAAICLQFFRKPVIDIASANPKLFAVVQELVEVAQMRSNIMLMKKYLTGEFHNYFYTFWIFDLHYF